MYITVKDCVRTLDLTSQDLTVQTVRPINFCFKILLTITIKGSVKENFPRKER